MGIRVRGILKGIGFIGGKSSPCIFHHGERGITTVIHGEGFTTLANEENNLKWLEENLKKKLEINHQPPSCNGAIPKPYSGAGGSSENQKRSRKKTPGDQPA